MNIKLIVSKSVEWYRRSEENEKKSSISLCNDDDEYINDTYNVQFHNNFNMKNKNEEEI